MPDSCGKGMTCCFTHWESGVCSYAERCEQIREYSLYSTLDTYHQTIVERPAPIHADNALVLVGVILVVLAAIYFVRRQE